jgi:hypothetical protein
MFTVLQAGVQSSKRTFIHINTRAHYIQAVGVMEWAMFVVLPADAQSSKPNVKIFNKAVDSSLETLRGETPRVCMYVGDSATLDAQGAASAGLKPVLVCVCVCVCVCMCRCVCWE